MARLDDVEIDRDEDASRGEPPTEGTPRSRRPLLIVAAAILVLALLAIFWMLSRRVEPGPEVAPMEPAVETEPSVAAEASEPVTAPEEPLPPLAESDPLVRRLVSEISPDPSLERWTEKPGLIETFVASVENVSLGAIPRAHLRFLAPQEPYRAVERDGRLVPDPASYDRYDRVTEVFTSVEPQALARAYERLRPLLQRAFVALGYPSRDFEDTFSEAVDLLLATPIPDEPPTLERGVGTYKYADPRLESLAPVQKQLLRMGPENARRVKAHLRRIAEALELERG